jgi:hypothetical protein
MIRSCSGHCPADECDEVESDDLGDGKEGCGEHQCDGSHHSWLGFVVGQHKVLNDGLKMSPQSEMTNHMIMMIVNSSQVLSWMSVTAIVPCESTQTQSGADNAIHIKMTHEHLSADTKTCNAAATQ